MGFVVKKMFGVAGFLLVCCFLMLYKNFFVVAVCLGNAFCWMCMCFVMLIFLWRTKLNLFMQ